MSEEFEKICTEDWDLYEKGKRYLEKKGLYRRTDTCFKFFEGDQWGEKPPEGMPQPQMNIIRQTVEYKVALVLGNGMSLNFSNGEFRDRALAKYTDAICPKVNSHIAKTWEKNNMDTHLWENNIDACIAGAVGCYSYFDEEEGIKVEFKTQTEFILSDEQEKDVQKQKFIIFPYRQMVCDVVAEARKNGISESEIKKIVNDDETQNMTGSGSKTEVETSTENDGKVLCLLKLWKDKDGFVCMRKSTKNTVFYKEDRLKQKLYPFSIYNWNLVKGGARGKGDVAEWIPNQIEINKNMARRAIAIMQCAYPTKVYDSERIDDVSALDEAGAAIGIDTGNVGDVNKLIGYLQPQVMSPDAVAYVKDLIEQTRELSGASSYALGNVNPENTSGKAILAVRDASAIPFVVQQSRLKKYIEDIGRIWWDIFTATSPDGLDVTYDGTENIEVGQDENGQAIMQEKKVTVVETITKDMMTLVKFNIKVDVSPSNAYSKFAVEQTLENFFMNQIIDFEEYVEALPDDSVSPKSKLKELVQKRAEKEKMLNELNQYKELFAGADKKYQDLANMLPQLEQEGMRILQQMQGGQNTQSGNNA